jgi:hypothetical protein
MASQNAPRVDAQDFHGTPSTATADCLPAAWRDALIARVGGEAPVFGYSSGAAVALKAAAGGSAITKLALYDLPPVVDGGLPRNSLDHAARLADLVAEGRRGDAVEYFQSKLAGIPDEIVAQLRHAPFRPALEAMAHTLVYKATIVGKRWRPDDLASTITVPTLAMAAGAARRCCLRAAQAPAAAVPGARALILNPRALPPRDGRGGAARRPARGEFTPAGVARGELRDDVPAELLALTIAGLTDVALVQRLTTDGTTPALDEIPELVLTLLLGAGSPSGSAS